LILARYGTVGLLKMVKWVSLRLQIRAAKVAARMTSLISDFCPQADEN
jgi:hypothetical protein